MDVIYRRCCGLDVHHKSVVACRIVPGAKGEPVKEVRTFGTMTADLLALGDWLEAAEVTHVALESTGVYWKPIWNLLEDRFTLLLVNPQHIKAVPGRKTDVKDCEWIADLLRHGLLQGSFVPDRPQRELRELTRYRTSLIRERVNEVNRLRKTLEGANLKLGAVVSDVTGVSARAILAELLAGQTDPAILADLARGKLRHKREALEQALVSSLRSHQRFLIAEHLELIDHFDEKIARVSDEIGERLRPFEEDLERLDTIPGVGRRTAEVLLAEVGPDLSRFPSAAHLASWAGLCPGNHQSAGKRRNGRTRPGNPWLRSALTESAQVVGRTRTSHLAAQFHRLLPRLGRKKTVLAIAHRILTIVYHLLRRGESFQNRGYFPDDHRSRDRLQRRLVRRLQRLGYSVSIAPVSA